LQGGGRGFESRWLHLRAGDFAIETKLTHIELAILNYMVQYQRQLDQTFAALADPTRRQVLERLGGGSATISELAEPFDMSLTGMKKHVRVLEEAELVQTEKVGRARRCSLGPRQLEDVTEWIEAYRRMLEERFDRLGELLEEPKGGRR
jgi:DNA-binding transcriptional ArsR family regulator